MDGEIGKAPDLVRDSLSVGSPLGNNPHGGGAGADGRAGDAEGVHDGWTR